MRTICTTLAELEVCAVLVFLIILLNIFTIIVVDCALWYSIADIILHCCEVGYHLV